ncbi:hypothetical protein BC829DRAFT_446925 [Chytridium lagenaria]|nr:hypothetical protein BC829DRAFT_446925 [Chytridium lagenaria]
MLDVNKDDTPSSIFPPALASPTPDIASASALPPASTESAVDSDWTILNKEDATTLSTPIQPSAPLPVSADLKTTFNEPLNEGLRNRKAPPAASSDIPATTDAPDAPAQGSPSTQPASTTG